MPYTFWRHLAGTHGDTWRHIWRHLVTPRRHLATLGDTWRHLATLWRHLGHLATRGDAPRHFSDTLATPWRHLGDTLATLGDTWTTPDTSAGQAQARLDPVGARSCRGSIQRKLRSLQVASRPQVWQSYRFVSAGQAWNAGFHASAASGTTYPLLQYCWVQNRSIQGAPASTPSTTLGTTAQYHPSVPHVPVPLRHSAPP